MIVSWIASHWYWFVGAGVTVGIATNPVMAWRLKWQVALAAVGALAVMQWMAASSLRAKLDSAQADSVKAQLKDEKDARDVERRHAADMTALEAQLTKENTDALVARDNLIADLRADRVRVRERFTCPKQAATAGASPARSDDPAQGGLSSADAELLLRIGAEADDVVRQLTTCQAVIRSDRALQKP